MGKAALKDERLWWAVQGKARMVWGELQDLETKIADMKNKHAAVVTELQKKNHDLVEGYKERNNATMSEYYREFESNRQTIEKLKEKNRKLEQTTKKQAQ